MKNYAETKNKIKTLFNNQQLLSDSLLKADFFKSLNSKLLSSDTLNKTKLLIYETDWERTSHDLPSGGSPLESTDTLYPLYGARIPIECTYNHTLSNVFIPDELARYIKLETNINALSKNDIIGNFYTEPGSAYILPICKIWGDAELIYDAWCLPPGHVLNNYVVNPEWGEALKEIYPSYYFKYPVASTGVHGYWSSTVNDINAIYFNANRWVYSTPDFGNTFILHPSLPQCTYRDGSPKPDGYNFPVGYNQYTVELSFIVYNYDWDILGTIGAAAGGNYWTTPPNLIGGRLCYGATDTWNKTRIGDYIPASGFPPEPTHLAIGDIAPGGASDLQKYWYYYYQLTLPWSPRSPITWVGGGTSWIRDYLEEQDLFLLGSRADINNDVNASIGGNLAAKNIKHHLIKKGENKYDIAISGDYMKYTTEVTQVNLKYKVLLDLPRYYHELRHNKK